MIFYPFRQQKILTLANEIGVVMDLLSHRKHNQLDLDALGVGLSNLYPPYGLVFSIR